MHQIVMGKKLPHIGIFESSCKPLYMHIMDPLQAP